MQHQQVSIHIYLPAMVPLPPPPPLPKTLTCVYVYVWVWAWVCVYVRASVHACVCEPCLCMRLSQQWGRRKPNRQWQFQWPEDLCVTQCLRGRPDPVSGQGSWKPRDGDVREAFDLVWPRIYLPLTALAEVAGQEQEWDGMEAYEERRKALCWLPWAECSQGGTKESVRVHWPRFVSCCSSLNNIFF